jgi:hypothetical protein
LTKANPALTNRFDEDPLATMNIGLSFPFKRVRKGPDLAELDRLKDFA